MKCTGIVSGAVARNECVDYLVRRGIRFLQIDVPRSESAFGGAYFAEEGRRCAEPPRLGREGLKHVQLCGGEVLEPVNGQDFEVLEGAEAALGHQGCRMPELAGVVVHFAVLKGLLVGIVEDREEPVPRRAHRSGHGAAEVVGLDAGGLEFAEEFVERLDEAGGVAYGAEGGGLLVREVRKALADNLAVREFADAADRSACCREQAVGQLVDRKDLGPGEDAGRLGGEEPRLGRPPPEGRRNEHQAPAGLGPRERFEVSGENAAGFAAASRPDDEFHR